MRFTEGCLAAFLLALGLAGPARTAPDDGLRCVANQLADAGFEIPEPPEATNPIFEAAALAWLGREPKSDWAAYGQFSEQDSLAWCRQIGLTDPDMQRHWPSSQRRDVSTEGLPDVAPDLLRAGEAHVRDQLEARWDIRLAGDFAVIAAPDPTTLQNVLQARLSERSANLRAPRIADRYCRTSGVGGLASRHFIALCWQGNMAAIVDLADIRSAPFMPVLAHEFMHQVQYELARDIPAMRSDDGSGWRLGPAWLVEGSAEVFEMQVFSEAQDLAGPGFFNLQSSARRDRSTLADLRRHGTVQGHRLYGTARFAVHLLAQKHGMKAVFGYFEALGRLRDQGLAFEEVFGQTMAEFEAEFETLRRDYGAALRYGR